MSQLFAFREDRLGFKIELGETTVLGRTPECDVILFDRSASRKHAEINKLETGGFAIADLGSTNGTLVNGASINGLVELKAFDTIKIGQELFVFEPGIQVLVGPSQSALIIEKQKNSLNNKIYLKEVFKAAEKISEKNIKVLMDLASLLAQKDKKKFSFKALEVFLKKTMGASFISILWPNKSYISRLSSVFSTPIDKRLLLDDYFFKKVINENQVALLSKTISELQFENGERKIEFEPQTALVGPLFSSDDKIGVLYIENNEKNYTEEDYNFFAALLLLISPSLSVQVKSASEKECRQLLSSGTGAETDPAYNINARDDNMKIVFATAAKVANGNTAIMISGETGTGKTDLAKYIHSQSPRRKANFIPLTLSTLDSGQIEQVLFGQYTYDFDYEDEKITTGLLELADGGTLFLRHIEYLPLALQRNLMMVIEEGLFFPLGARRSRAIDIRLISSSSVDLWSLVETGYFREDLYLRLNQINIAVPPLRKTLNDIEYLVEKFMGRIASDLGIKYNGIEPAAVGCLRAYPWPGNISELRSEAETFALFGRDGKITLDSLPLHLRFASEIFIGEINNANTLVGEAERHILIRTLARCAGNVEKMALLLSVPAEKIILKMRAFGLDPMDYQPPMQEVIPRGPGQTSVPSDIE